MNSFTSWDSVLMHYGVPGMRKGVRKDPDQRSDGGVTTSAQVKAADRQARKLSRMTGQQRMQYLTRSSASQYAQQPSQAQIMRAQAQGVRRAQAQAAINKQKADAKLQQQLQVQRDADKKEIEAWEKKNPGKTYSATRNRHGKLIIKAKG